MKKITLLATIVIATSFASCKKKYTCTCTGTSNGASGVYSYDLGKIRKKNAKSSCDAATLLGGMKLLCIPRGVPLTNFLYISA